MDKLKVLFHVNDPERWQRTLLNIKNFVLDVGQEHAEIEVVANGAAVSVYADTGSCEKSTGCGKAGGDLLEQMNKMAETGIRFAACRNALRMHSIVEKTLPPFVRVVPAGITEIVKKQADGYAYIKP